MSFHQCLKKDGYIIKKDKIDETMTKKIRKDLTVSPIVIKAYQDFCKPVEFEIFQESPNYFYLPRFYGVETFGAPKKDYLPSGTPIDLAFIYGLLPHQITAHDKTIGALREVGGGVLQVCCGFGKCLSRGTPVLLYNGTIKNVEDVVVGDQLMGDDSTPRNVLSLARGQEEMYEIQPIKGDKWGCNKSHILSLKCSTNYSKKFAKGSIHDIELAEFLDYPDSFHGKGTPLRLYKVPVVFPHKEVDLDPYMLGYWLGDGDSAYSRITTINPEIVEYFQKNIKQYNLSMKQGQVTEHNKGIYYNITLSTYDSDSDQWSKVAPGKNYFTCCLQKYNLINNKHIPMEYKCNSRDIQLKVLAGLIDSDGYLSHNYYEIVQKNEKLLDDIVFMCRSLGFAAYKSTVQKTCTNSESSWAIRENPDDKYGRVTGTYYKCSLSGKGLEEIPVLLAYKKAQPRKQIKDALVNGFSVKSVGIGDYYGFAIDGNRRFLLGDFTVTHNTALAIKISTELGVKTLVVVNKECLMDQWAESITKFTGGKARIGILQQDKMEVENKDYVIAMLHSLCKKEYPKDMFNDIGFAIVDECFPADTYIITEHGNISIVDLFDMWSCRTKTPLILSFNEAEYTFEYHELTHAWVKSTSQLVEIKLTNDTIQCTPRHKFLTIYGYKEAMKLVSGDSLILNDGTTKVVSTRTINCNTTVYDIEVADNHNFIVVGKGSKEPSSGPVVHNCHHISSEMFSKALPKITSKYMLGLSATPNRKDGLSHVFHKYMGPTCHSEKRSGANRVLVKRFKLTSNSPMYETLYMNNGIKNTVAMITNLSKCEARTALIVESIRMLMKQDRKILLLSGRREHLEDIYRSLEQATIMNIHGKKITFGYYYGNQGGNKQRHKQMLEASAKCDVVLGTLSIACLSDQTVYVNYLTGEEMKLETIAKQKTEMEMDRDIHFPVINLNEATNEFELGKAINIGYTPPKQCYKLVHKLGEIVASHDHQFYTQRGWVSLEQLTIKDYLICDRKVTVTPIDIPELTEDDCWLIGCLMGDGAISQYQKGTLGFINIDDDITKEMSRILAIHGMEMVLKKDEIYKYRIRRIGGMNPEPTWLRTIIVKYDLGHKGIDKSFAQEMMVMPDKKIAGLLGGLYDTDGTASNKRRVGVKAGGQGICYNTSSYKMKNQVVFLLKRLGVQSTVTSEVMVTGNILYRVNILSSELEAFNMFVDIRLSRKKDIIMSHLDETKIKSSIFNSIPQEYIRKLRDDLKNVSMYEISKAIVLLKNNHLSYNALSQRKAMTYGSYKFLCDHYGFEDQFINKFFISIKSIEKLENSEQIKLCDMTVKTHHNFLIGGILVHNSEGLDLPGLNTEILATPSTDVEQAVGRILRKFHEKVNPIVIDLVDSCGNFSKQAAVRAKFYKSEKYEIHDLKLSLGDDTRDLQKVLPEVQEYLLNTQFKKKTSSKDNGDEDNNDNDEDEDEDDDETERNVKKVDTFGKCLLSDDNEPPKPKSKCLLADDEPAPKSKTKCLLVDDEEPTLKSMSKTKCLLVDDKPKPIQSIEAKPRAVLKLKGKCVL
jgi:intein/homing endonuclease